jgi:hypothetical protein
MDEIEALNRAIWLSDAGLAPTADRLDRLAARFRRPGTAAGEPDPAGPDSDPFAPSLARLQGAAG